MYDIETIQVTSNARVKKTFSTGWGVGVCRVRTGHIPDILNRGHT